MDSLWAEGTMAKNSPVDTGEVGDMGSISGSKILSIKMATHSVFLFEKFQGQRSLGVGHTVGLDIWAKTEHHLSTTFSSS